jgi:hypothetical protein
MLQYVQVILSLPTPVHHGQLRLPGSVALWLGYFDHHTLANN